MKKLSYLFIAIVFASCGGGQTFETENGTKVTYHKKGEDVAPSDTLISYFLLKYETSEGKVLFESSEDAPTPVRLDSSFFQNEGDFFEIMGKVNVGDSISYQMTASELFLENFKGQMPDSVNAEDMITVSASFLDQVSMKEYEQKSLGMRREQSLDRVDQEQVAKDVEVIDAYLEENGIDAEESESGIRYVVTEPGDGPKLELGSNIKVFYAGRTLEGEYFDTNIEEVAKEQGLYNEQARYQPYPIRIYNSPVITGWHEGFLLLNDGAEATFYIPSSLAYGPTGRPNSELINANTILVFDVKLVE